MAHDKSSSEPGSATFKTTSPYHRHCIYWKYFWFQNKNIVNTSTLNRTFTALLQNHRAQIYAVSVFGDPYDLDPPKHCTKIFYSGENLRFIRSGQWSNFFESKENRDKFDLLIDFEERDWEMHVRVPLWMIRYIFRCLSYAHSKLQIDELDELIYGQILNFTTKCNNPSLRDHVQRTRSFSMIASHDSLGTSSEFAGLRTEIVKACENLGKVDCAGALLNNTSELNTRFNNEKLAFLKLYKFNICPENSNAKGYVTEKIFDSIASGAVPIYAGSDGVVEPGILNPNAFIYYDRKDPKGALEMIERLFRDRNAYKTFIEQPPFTKDAAENIYKIYTNLKSAINKLSSAD